MLSGDLFDLTAAAAIGPLTGELLLSWGPLVAILLPALLLLRELISLYHGNRRALRWLDAFIVPLFILFTVQIGLVLLEQ